MRRDAAWSAGCFAAILLATACTDHEQDRRRGPTSAGAAVGGAGVGGAGVGGASTTVGAGGAGGIAPAQFEPGEERPGGDTTVDARDATSFIQPASNLSAMRRGTFEAGLALFDVAWTVGGEVDRNGLGPTYVGTSCRSCHFRGGRGAPPPPGQPMTSMLVRLSIPLDGGSLGADPRYGDQIQNKAIPGVTAEGWFSVDYEPRAGTYPDGTDHELLAPTLAAHDLA